MRRQTPDARRQSELAEDHSDDEKTGTACHKPKRVVGESIKVSEMGRDAGIAAHLGYLDALADNAFWLVAGGAGLLVIGVVFRKL